MRLIDADTEIERLEKRKQEYEEQLAVCGIGQRDMIERVIFDIKQKIDFLKQCPTAYDVDKVVEQITDCKKGIDNAISDDEFFRSGVKAGLTMAIEIVKEGCIE